MNLPVNELVLKLLAFRLLHTAGNGSCIDSSFLEQFGKHEFSFITKLLHTIEPSRPIYDSQVDIALGIRRCYQPNFEEKLRQDEQILAQISAAYRELASSPGVIELLAEFDKIIPDHTMSAEQKIDFILWALGGISFGN